MLALTPQSVEELNKPTRNAFKTYEGMRRYKELLAKAEIEVQKRIDDNDCPRREIDDYVIIGLVSSGGYGKVVCVMNRLRMFKH